MEQAVLQAGTDDLNMVGELEAALEGTRGDALVQDLALALLGGLHAFLRAADGQRVLTRLDGEILLGEAGDGDADAVIVLAGALDIVGGYPATAPSGPEA